MKDARGEEGALEEGEHGARVAKGVKPGDKVRKPGHPKGVGRDQSREGWGGEGGRGEGERPRH